MPEKKKKQNHIQSTPVWLWVAGGILIVLIVILIVTGRTPNNAEISPSVTDTAQVLVTSSPAVTTSSLPSEISPAEVAQYQSEGAFILDVREQREWIEGHIDGAILIPLGELPNRLSEVPLDKMVIVVCRSGKRSSQGRDILLNAGYPQVTSMAGGMIAWQDQGNSIVTGE